MSVPTGPEVLSVRVHPNPLKTMTVIDVTTTRPDATDIRIVDIGGREVASFTSLRPVDGRISVVWDARDRHGMPLTTGAYWIVAQSGPHRAQQVITIVR